MRCVRLLGTRIESAHLFHSLPECPGPGDVLVLRQEDPGVGPDEGGARVLGQRVLPDGTAYLALREHARGFEMAFPGIVRFFLSSGLRQVVYRPGGEEDLHLIETYFGGHVLGWMLQKQGREVLHGGCVTRSGRALMILGPKGAGKSTLTAELVAAGAALVSDDLVPLGIGVHGAEIPGGDPRMKLSGATLQHLESRHGAMGPPQGGVLKKTFLIGREWGRYEDGPHELAAAVLLPREAGSHEGPPRLTKAPPARALMGLVANTYDIDLLSPERRALQIARFTDLLRSVPVYELTRAHGFEHLEETCHLLSGLL